MRISLLFCVSAAKSAKKHYRSECVDRAIALAYRVARVFKRSEFVRKHKETAQKTPYFKAHPHTTKENAKTKSEFLSQTT